MKNVAFAIVLFLAIAFAIPAISMSEESTGYVAPNAEHYSYVRLASISDTVVVVDVKDVHALRDSSGMIVSGEDSCISMKAKVIEVLKGAPAEEIVIFAPGHQWYSSGKMLKGKAIFFLSKKPCNINGAIPKKWSAELETFSTVDKYGKILLKGMDDAEVAAYINEVKSAIK